MAWLVRRCESTYKYDTSSVGTYDNVSATDSNTISSFDRGFEYYVGIPRRCSRCRMYDWETGVCRKKKKAETCRKSYSIKKKK